MTSLLDRWSEPVDLIESAKECENLLDRLKKYAADSKPRHLTLATKHLLDEVVKHVNGSIASLRTWVAEIRKGRQTKDKNIIRTVDKHFEELQGYIAAADDALHDRLKHRMRGLRTLRPSQKEEASARVSHALEEITETIGYLQNQVKTVLRDSPDQKQLHSRIDKTLYGRPRSKSYDVFKRALGRMSFAERQTIRFGTLLCLWKEFPQRLDLDGKVGSADNPGDGLVYTDSEVTDAKSLLKDFYDAWSETTMQASRALSGALPKVEKITGMAKICLILRGMKQERLLDDFYAHQKVDESLPLHQNTVEGILQREDACHATTFVTEQYRAVRRTWKDGDHLEIPDEEPLPLIFERDYRSGSYGMVQRHRDAFSEACYARKEQVAPDARKHMEREIARLKRLNHRHIVQYVKSYQRGRRFGMLLKPAATTDLERLLTRYHRNRFDYERNRRDRVVLFPIILTAFGCLSRSLAHIHGCSIRHKDIKPANILFEKALSPNHCARFLWADFGLAHDFSNAGNSKTRSRSRYSPRYAAPEIMKAANIVIHTKTVRERRTDPNEEFDDESDFSFEEHAEYSDKVQPHGRKSDIFSFGCVFLEVLSVLIDEEFPKPDPGQFQAYAPFWQNTAGLQEWAERQMKDLAHDPRLEILFKLGVNMIHPEPDKRPSIDRVVADLRAAGSSYFCTACLQDPDDPIPEKSEPEKEEVDKDESGDHGSDSNEPDEHEIHDQHNGERRLMKWPSTESHRELVSEQRPQSSRPLSPERISLPKSALRSSNNAHTGRSRSPPNLRQLRFED